MTVFFLFMHGSGNGLSILMTFRPGVWTTLPQWLMAYQVRQP